jgi:DNA-nicking Smr family endonuclease
MPTAEFSTAEPTNYPTTGRKKIHERNTNINKKRKEEGRTQRTYPMRSAAAAAANLREAVRLDVKGGGDPGLHAIRQHEVKSPLRGRSSPIKTKLDEHGMRAPP